jgi:hypothetical protein
MTRQLGLVLSMIMLAVAAAVAVAPSAHGALGLRPTSDQTWMTNGNVYAQALSEDKRILYIGGEFTQLRENPVGQGGKVFKVNNVAAIDVATGTPIRKWHPSVNNGDAATEVRALAVMNRRVYIGGRFNAVDGQPRRNLAAVDVNIGKVSSFAPTVGDSTSAVYTVLPSNSRLYEGPRLYIGGKFQKVNGKRRKNLASFTLPSGSLNSTWQARASATVRKLMFDSSGGTIFAGGAFTSVTGSDGTTAERRSLARFNTDSGTVTPWTIPKRAIPSGRIIRHANPIPVRDFTVTPTRLYAGFGGPKQNWVAAFRLDDGNFGNLVWRFRLEGNPQSLAISPDRSRLIIGGHFGINDLDQRVCDDKYLKGLVAVNLDNGAVDCSWIPSLDQAKRPDYDGAWVLTTVGDHVWVGGGFIGVSGVPQTNLARFTYATGG